MAGVKISQLPAGTTPTGAELFPAVQGGVTVSLTLSEAFTALSPPINYRPSPPNTITLGTSADSFANGYFGPNGVPVYDVASGGIGYTPQSAKELALGINPIDFFYPVGNAIRYGADPTGAVSSGTAFSHAAETGWGFIPPGTYLISGTDSVGIPANCALTAAKGSVKINITANSGTTAAASAAFQLLGPNSTVSGLVLNYPNQTLADLVADIVLYPPTFTINPANTTGGSFCTISDITCTGAYVFSSVQSSFAECLWQNIVSYSTLLHGMDFSGSVGMGDTSRAVNCQFVMTGTQGFNNGPVNQWCQQNSVGVSAVSGVAGNRIDQFILDNFGVVGGNIAFSIGTECWFQGSEISADSVVTSIFINGAGSQFYVDNLWGSLQLAAFPIQAVPGIHAGPSAGILKISNGNLGFMTGGAGNAVFIEGGVVELNQIRFATSLGGFGPLIFNAQGQVSVNGCTVETQGGSTNGVPRPVTWRDCCIGTTGGLGTATPAFSIDGIQAPVSETGLLSMTNFNMASWSGGAPVGWNVSAGANNSAFINNLNPITGQNGIQFGGTGVGGPYVVSFTLPQADDDIFGFYLFTCSIQVTAPTASPATLFYIRLEDNSATRFYINDVAWGGASGQTIAIPQGNPYTLGVLLCAPTGNSPNIFTFVVNQQTSSNQLIQIGNLQLWGMAPPTGVTGSEYWRAQTNSLQRDMQLAWQRRCFRPAPPTAGTWGPSDTIVNSAIPSAGITEWRCTTPGTPGTWTGLTIP